MSGSLVLRTLAESIAITLIVVLSLTVVSAQVRSSTNYQIQSDSINLGGGLSSSGNYSLESTAGELATGQSTSTNFSLRAGYQQMQEVFISISTPATVVMDTALPGLTGGVSNGSTTVTVVTDSSSGYQMSILATEAPAMKKGTDVINDYVPVSSPSNDFTFTTAPGQVHFGFSPTGAHVVQAFRNNTTVCGVGSLSTPQRCWRGLATTSIQVASGSGANHPAGATTTLQFRVGHGGGVSVPNGTYIATTTVTALPL